MNLVETGGCRLSLPPLKVCEKTEKWRHRRERELNPARLGSRASKSQFIDLHFETLSQLIVRFHHQQRLCHLTAVTATPILQSWPGTPR